MILQTTFSIQRFNVLNFFFIKTRFDVLYSCDELFNIYGVKDQDKGEDNNIHISILLPEIVNKDEYIRLKCSTYDAQKTHIFGLDAILFGNISVYYVVLVWLSGSALVSINKVTLCQARLLLGWVTGPG